MISLLSGHGFNYTLQDIRSQSVGSFVRSNRTGRMILTGYRSFGLMVRYLREGGARYFFIELELIESQNA
jgi:hypothetical protein